jgi:hypothetical protein
MAINIEDFLKRYGEEYNNLYEGKRVVKNYPKLLEKGDEFIRTHPDFVGQVVKIRNDFISSDREVVALMLAVKALNIEKELDFQQQAVSASKKTHKKLDFER